MLMIAMWLRPPAFGSTNTPICSGRSDAVPPNSFRARRRCTERMSKARPSAEAVTPLSSRSAAFDMLSAL